jgi:hypothetical protein
MFAGKAGQGGQGAMKTSLRLMGFLLLLGLFLLIILKPPLDSEGAKALLEKLGIGIVVAALTLFASQITNLMSDDAVKSVSSSGVDRFWPRQIMQIEDKAYKRIFASANEIKIWGVTLQGLLMSDAFNQLQESKAGVKILVLDYEEAARIPNILGYANLNYVDSISKTWQTAEDRLKQLETTFPGRIEIRRRLFPQTIGLQIFYSGRPRSGIAVVQLHPFRADPGDRPSFRIKQTENPAHFAVYEGAFERAWNLARGDSELLKEIQRNAPKAAAGDKA